MILITTQLKKAQDYLDGTIKNSKLNTTSRSPNILAKILFLDNNPTLWTIVLIIYNIKNLIRLGVIINSTITDT